MALQLITGPSVEPVTVDELKLHARISGDSEDTLLAIYIKAARGLCEGKLNRALIDQTWRLTLDQFGSVDHRGAVLPDIQLQMPTVRSITSVQYIDPNGDVQTLASSAYALDAATTPGWLFPADGTEWPDTDDVINAVTITFVAGFGADATAVPDAIKAWILLTAATLYGNRESVDASGRVGEMPCRFVDSLLDFWTIYWA